MICQISVSKWMVRVIWKVFYAATAAEVLFFKSWFRVIELGWLIAKMFATPGAARTLLANKSKKEHQQNTAIWSLWRIYSPSRPSCVFNNESVLWAQARKCSNFMLIEAKATSDKSSGDRQRTEASRDKRTDSLITVRTQHLSVEKGNHFLVVFRESQIGPLSCIQWVNLPRPPCLSPSRIGIVSDARRDERTASLPKHCLTAWSQWRSLHMIRLV